MKNIANNSNNNNSKIKEEKKERKKIIKIKSEMIEKIREKKTILAIFYSQIVKYP